MSYKKETEDAMWVFIFSILFLIEKILNWLDSNKYNCL